MPSSQRVAIDTGGVRGLPGPSGGPIPSGGTNGQIIGLVGGVPTWIDPPVTGGGGTGTVQKVNNKSPDGTGNVTLTKADVGLDQVPNIDPDDLPLSVAATAAINDKAPILHLHDTDYVRFDQTTPNLTWRTGDATPSWAGSTRPAGLKQVTFILDPADTVPSWKAARDIVLFSNATASGPTIRSYGSYTAMTSDSTTASCTYPATASMADGDTLWLCVATNATTPTTPSGWSVYQAFLSSGASATDGLIIYKRDLTSGQAASLGGTTQTVTLGTSTSAVASIVCWTGARTTDVVQSHTDDANTASAQVFASITPGAVSTVVGVSALRYNTVTGAPQAVNPRTGWTELFDRSTNKAAAPQRGLLFTVRDTPGASGTAIPGVSATTTNVVRTADYVISVV